jgi:hypothetical protein
MSTKDRSCKYGNGSSGSIKHGGISCLTRRPLLLGRTLLRRFCCKDPLARKRECRMEKPSAPLRSLSLTVRSVYVIMKISDTKFFRLTGFAFS